MSHVESRSGIWKNGTSAGVPESHSRSNFPRPDFRFVGREKEIAKIHGHLVKDRWLVINQQRVPHSNGGMGKTSLAIAYGWAHAADYPGGVFFIDGSARFLLTELAKLADRLEVKDGINQQQTAMRVARVLSTGPPALLVIDALRDEESWDEAVEANLIPKGKCRTIITTHLSWVGELETFTLRGLSPDDGTQLLARYREDAANEKSRKLLRDIVEGIDGLPLGLTLIGTYMVAHPDMSWIACADKLQEFGIETKRSKRSGAISVPEFSVILNAFFDEVLESLALQHRATMEFAALLPELQVVSQWLSEIVDSDDIVKMAKMGNREPTPSRQVLTDLVTWQLLRSQSADNRVLALHPALRNRLHQRCEEGKYLHQQSSNVIRALARSRVAACTSKRHDKSMHIELTPLVELVKELRSRGQLDKSVKTVRQAALLLHKLRRFHDVVALMESFVTEEAIATLEPDIGSVLLSDHASGLSAIGQDESAKEFMKRAILIDKKHLPDDHPTLAAHYSNYAGILKNLQELSEARKFIIQAIKIEQKHYGKADRRLALRHWWLADIELADGKKSDASLQYQRARKILLKHVKPNHEHVVALDQIIQKLDEPSAETSPNASTQDASDD